MQIIEIQSLKNGAHKNQSGDFYNIPEGWAVIPDNIKTPNFPFGEVEVEDINGVMTVTRWIAGVVPEVEEPEEPVNEFEQLRADIDYLALMTEVEL